MYTYIYMYIHIYAYTYTYTFIPTRPIGSDSLEKPD